MNADEGLPPATPADLRDLAARADELAEAIAALHRGLRDALDEPTQRSGFRLGDAAGAAHRIAAELHATASDLARVRGRGECPADWGVCPEHGNTLSSSGGTSWCRSPGCGRAWNYDRAGLPCTELVMYQVTGEDGSGGPMCGGHARDARQRLTGVVITTLGPSAEQL